MDSVSSFILITFSIRYNQVLSSFCLDFLEEIWYESENLSRSMRKALEVFVSIWNDEIQECSVLNNTKKGEG